MQDVFESIQEASSKDSVVWICQSTTSKVMYFVRGFLVDEGFGRTELHASTPADRGYRGCIASL
jgi:hypothetical protein